MVKINLAITTALKHLKIYGMIQLAGKRPKLKCPHHLWIQVKKK
jgi:hypothetical protein